MSDLRLLLSTPTYQNALQAAYTDTAPAKSHPPGPLEVTGNDGVTAAGCGGGGGGGAGPSAWENDPSLADSLAELLPAHSAGQPPHSEPDWTLL